jgi:hypothetical protein
MANARPVPLLAVLSAALLCAGPARAGDGDEKQACVAAFESAQSLRAKGKLRAAREALRICSRPACPGLVRDPCVRWLPEVEGSISTVRIEARDGAGNLLTGAKIRVDHGPVEEPGALELDPGAHLIEVEGIGETTLERSITLAGGERALLITVRPPAAPTPPEAARPAPVEAEGVPPLAYLLGGIGVVGLGSFGVFGLLGRSEQKDLESSCSPRCSPAQAEPVRRKYLFADISLGVGLVALGAATWISLSSNPTPTTARLGVGVARGGASLLLQGNL